MNKKLFILAVLIFVGGIGIGFWFAAKKLENGHSVDVSAAKKPLFYRNPMNPTVTSPVPAKDAMGMDYVPVYADSSNTDSSAEKNADAPGTVDIDPVTMQNMGVRTVRAKKDILSHVVRTVGRVDYDEERIVRLHPKVEGWVENLYVDKTAEHVRQDQELLSIYSPQLVVSQQEYILALNNLANLEKSTVEDIRIGAQELLNSTRERLRLLDVPEHQLQHLMRNHNIHKTLHIHSPASGIVVNIGAREGQYVTPNTEIYTIADLSTVWVYADIYENELPWVKVGDRVEMQLAGIPGRIYNGHLAFIFPYAEAETRTIKVRLNFNNPELLLKPDMFADVTIYASKQMDVLVIPSEAVIRSGVRDKVLVMRSPGKFEPRAITTGISTDGIVAVIEGLQAGEEVVVSSQFLIDSESRLREATAKMLEPGLQPLAPSRLQLEEVPHDHD